MLTQTQNIIIFLMFLTGILFLGLNFIACSIVFPGPKGSKRIGYVLILAVILAFLVQQQHQALGSLDFSPGQSRQILLLGMVLPVFTLSLVYYRVKKKRLERKRKATPQPETQTHETD